MRVGVGKTWKIGVKERIKGNQNDQIGIEKVIELINHEEGRKKATIREISVNSGEAEQEA